MRLTIVVLLVLRTFVHPQFSFFSLMQNDGERRSVIQFMRLNMQQLKIISTIKIIQIVFWREFRKGFFGLFARKMI
jgi:hypothetical protein